MGGTASRIWSDICAIESNHIRASMIERVAMSPDMLMTAGRYGVYLGEESMEVDGMKILPVMKFLRMLHLGEIY